MSFEIVACEACGRPMPMPPTCPTCGKRVCSPCLQDDSCTACSQPSVTAFHNRYVTQARSESKHESPTPRLDDHSPSKLTGVNQTQAVVDSPAHSVTFQYSSHAMRPAANLAEYELHKVAIELSLADPIIRFENSGRE